MLTVAGQNEDGRSVIDARTNLIQNIQRQLGAAGMTLRRRVAGALEDDGLARVRYWLHTRRALVCYHVGIRLVNQPVTGRSFGG